MSADWAECNQGLRERNNHPESSEGMAKREATTPEPRTPGGQGPGEGLSRRLEDVEEKCAGVEGNSGNENPEGKGLEAGAAACQDCRMAFCSR